MARTVTFTATEVSAVSVALLGDGRQLTDQINRCRQLACADPKFAQWAVNHALQRAQARQAYCALWGLTPSHFTFNEAWR